MPMTAEGVCTFEGALLQDLNSSFVMGSKSSQGLLKNELLSATCSICAAYGPVICRCCADILKHDTLCLPELTFSSCFHAQTGCKAYAVNMMEQHLPH